MRLFDRPHASVTTSTADDGPVLEALEPRLLLSGTVFDAPIPADASAAVEASLEAGRRNDRGRRPLDAPPLAPKPAPAPAPEPAAEPASEPTPAPSDPGDGFDIDISFNSNVSSSVAEAFREAAAVWTEVIVGDLPDIRYAGSLIDDVLVQANIIKMDGVGGVLGHAGPLSLRAGSHIPYRGVVELDVADVDSLAQHGKLVDVIAHELGHVLGFGTVWTNKRLIDGRGGDNPSYTGAHAVAEYRAAYDPTANSVPVEASGGRGTRDAHWRESIMGSELMTGWMDFGSTPLSRVTIASMADLGYEVSIYSGTGQPRGPQQDPQERDQDVRVRTRRR